MKHVKAMLFDLDGTLIDTEKYYRRCWPAACAHFGFTMTDDQVLKLRSLGRPFAPRQFEKWFGPAFDYKEVREYRKLLFEQCVAEEGIQLKPGAKELLTYLREKGIITAIATATDQERTARYLERVGLTGYFDKICSAADVPEGKPSPDVYREACAQLGLSPEVCVAVEDAPNGIRAAHGAGCRVIFAPDQTRDEPEVEPLTVAKIETLFDIIDLLQEND